MYLHGNSGCRIEAYHVAKKICQMGVTVVGFDFSGCGQSEGKYVTLGIKERHDIRNILQYLQSQYNFKRFVLWGRSMGSVAALMYMNTYATDTRVKALILDSPFSKLKESIISIGKK